MVAKTIGLRPFPPKYFSTQFSGINSWIIPLIRSPRARAGSSSME